MTLPYVDLIGAPFEYGGRGPETFDCYGVVMTMAARDGVKLPDFFSPTDQGEIELAMGLQRASKDWIEVPRAENTIVLFRVGRFVSHVGWVLDRYGYFLHAWKRSGGVTRENLNHGDWKGRIVGFYRYVD